MVEKLNCSSCNAIINTSSLKCDYCGNSYRMNGKSADLINLKDHLDKMLTTSEPVEIINYINNSAYKNHPIVRFRLAKAEMLICLFLNRQINSDKFCAIINIIDEITEVTPDYRMEFINFTINFLPSLDISLYSEDFINISTFLKNKTFDSYVKLINRLTEQLLVSELGEKFMKEYLFYTDEKNFIDDVAFLKKKEYLVKKYNTYKNEVLKNNYS